jgi:hypothetical protein
MEAKPEVPVDVSLTSSTESGTVHITLNLTAKADIPRAVGKIVLPPAVKLIHGETRLDLGALKNGESRQLQVIVQVPAHGRFEIFAAVDCHISSGILMHKSAPSLVLGQ